MGCEFWTHLLSAVSVTWRLFSLSFSASRYLSSSSPSSFTLDFTCKQQRGSMKVCILWCTQKFYGFHLVVDVVATKCCGYLAPMSARPGSSCHELSHVVLMSFDQSLVFPREECRCNIKPCCKQFDVKGQFYVVIYTKFEMWHMLVMSRISPSVNNCLKWKQQCFWV